ncbi:regulatory helix-turn-helix protein, lysR family [Streptomyces mirabilis]|jgi:DNA-binding transcriptional LysR family regulator|uniref:Regulatory helix-turn-helix protein, lysR family n=1 Tax=Streptomyces mirabilis TaxID=68239 RepID=A0A1I2YCA0_9ACTN|nr:regulatory helix-turn-helix protein, lysR family [Streptomyces mirabilis]
MESPAKPPEFSLRQLVYFVAVAVEGTLTEATQRLCISQSA